LATTVGPALVPADRALTEALLAEFDNDLPSAAALLDMAADITPPAPHVCLPLANLPP
jgi:hypothetical protein